MTADWVCLHSLGIAHHPYKRRAEIDFLLLTPQGIFVLEVKGGRVRRKDGVWLYTNRHGQTSTSAEGPVKQAESAMFSLERSLRQRFSEKKRICRVMLGFAVMFPDVEYSATGIELDARQVFDVRSRSAPFARFVRDLVEFTREVQPTERNGLRKEELAEIVDFLQGDFDLVPRFSTAAAATVAELTRLTRDQYQVLRADESEDRLLVHGPAGTGKTLLALEVARREARAGRSALLLCYNHALALRLAAQLREDQKVTVASYHGHLLRAVRGTSVEQEVERSRMALRANEFFNDALPELAAYALLESQQDRTDVLILDEAQDIMAPRFTDALAQMVKGGLEGGRWRIFLDRNTQASVYGNFDESCYRTLRRAGISLTLSTNCRNTIPIETATRLVAAPKSSARSTLSGDSVERRWCQSRDEVLPSLRKLLTELWVEGVARDQVTILFARKLDETWERGLRDLGLAPFDPSRAKPEGAVYAVASGFKGLESDVVVFTGIDELESEWSRAIAYVAMSRARVRLYLLLPEKLEPLLLKRFEQGLLEHVHNDDG